MHSLVYGSRYMVVSGWVKNVNNMRILGGKVSGTLSPIFLYSHLLFGVRCVKQIVIRPITPQLSLLFSTQKKPISHLLIVTYTLNPQPLLLRPLEKI